MNSLFNNVTKYNSDARAVVFYPADAMAFCGDAFQEIETKA